MTPKQLHTARQALGLSQAAMARELGLTRYWYAQLENGNAKILPVYALAVEALLRRAKD